MLSVPKSVGRVVFDPFKTLWLWGMILPTFCLGFPLLNLKLVMINLSLVFLTLCLGHSVGLHRLIIHRAFVCKPWLRALLSYLFVFTGLGGPLSWARLHADRDYWQNKHDCPDYFAYRHSMFIDFFVNLHMRFIPKQHESLTRLPGDIFNDQWLNFLEKTWPLHNLALAMVFYVFMGYEAVVVCICGRITCSILGHWAIGYAAHVWGEQPIEIEGACESGTNIYLLGLISFGEGFHNYHHAHPRSARMGLGPLDFDLGWFVVRTLESLGLVSEVIEAQLDVKPADVATARKVAVF